MPPTPKTTLNRLRKAFEELDAIGAEYRAARDKVNQDPHLSHEGRAAKVQQLRTEAGARIGAQQQATAEAMADHQLALRFASEMPAPTGVEGVAARIEATDARARVRGLLTAGHEPGQIIERALATSDLVTLDALQAEAQWLNPSAGVPEGLIQRIDQARMELLPDDQADALRELHAFTAQRDGLIARITRAPSELDQSTGTSLDGAIADRFNGITTPGGLLGPEATGTEGDAA